MLSEVMLYFYYWYFISIWNQICLLHWKWIQMSVTVLSVPIDHEHQGSTVPARNNTVQLLHLPFTNTKSASSYQITVCRLQVLYHLTDTICLITIINQAGECAKEAHLFMCSLVNLVHHLRTTICTVFTWKQQFLQYCFCNIVVCFWSGALAQWTWHNLFPAIITHMMTSFTLQNRHCNNLMTSWTFQGVQNKRHNIFLVTFVTFLYTEEEQYVSTYNFGKEQKFVGCDKRTNYMYQDCFLGS